MSQEKIDDHISIQKEIIKFIQEKSGGDYHLAIAHTTNILVSMIIVASKMCSNPNAIEDFKKIFSDKLDEENKSYASRKTKA